MTTTTRDLLIDAQTLAEFSNLDDERKVDYFRNNFAEFLPTGFWLWSGNRGGSWQRFWQTFQSKLRDAWQGGFSLEQCVELISVGIAPEIDLADPEGPQNCGPWAQLLGSAASKAWPLPIINDISPGPWNVKVYPYQRAVMLLGLEPWRARFCPGCGERFAADKPGRRFCGTKCSQQWRRKAKRAWWNERGENRRAKQQAESKRSSKTHTR